jgi:hypothetical protein
MTPRILPLVVGLMIGLPAGPASAQLRGYDDEIGVPPFGVLSDIDPNTGLGSVPSEFEGCGFSPKNLVLDRFLSDVGFTSGLASVGDTLHGLEWDGGSGPDIFLYTIGVGQTGLLTGCVEGRRVGTQPVGFENLESLEYVPSDGPSGTLYSVDFDFDPPHQGQLIQIDPNTGVGTAVGSPMASDVYVGGLAYDPVSDLLYALTLGFAGRAPELLTIDRTTGQVGTVVGEIAAPEGPLQSLAVDTSVTPTRLLAAGTQLYELDPNTGVATAIGGGFTGTVWGMTSIAGDPCDGLGGDTDGDTLCDDEDPCQFFENTLPLVISGFSGIPDECLCGDFDGDGFHSATDAAAINDCAAFIRFDCVSERDEVAEPFDGFYSATDADLVNRVAAFLDPAYTLACPRRPEGTCGGDTGVSCF